MGHGRHGPVEGLWWERGGPCPVLKKGWARIDVSLGSIASSNSTQLVHLWRLCLARSFITMPGTNMKSSRGGGARRVHEPVVDMELLEDQLKAYLRHVTTQSTAWDLESYNDLQVASAAQGKDLVRNLPSSKVLLAVSPSMVVPYSVIL